MKSCESTTNHGTAYINITGVKIVTVGQMTNGAKRVDFVCVSVERFGQCCCQPAVVAVLLTKCRTRDVYKRQPFPLTDLRQNQQILSSV